MPEVTRSPLRLLAPVALVVFGIIFLIVIVSSSGTGDSGDGGGERSGRDGESAAVDGGGKPESGREDYTVKTGDTLDEIAAETGLSVDELQELNPTLDPQALVTGQRINLRE